MHLATLLTLPLLAAAIPAPPAPPGDAQAVFGVDAAQPNVNIDLNELRLVKFSEDEPPKWITELEKIEARARGRKMMDITDTPTLGLTSFLNEVKYEYQKPGKFKKEIKSLYKNLSEDRMREFLTKFTAFRTRYYKSQTGKDSQRFLLGTLKEIAKGQDGIKISEFEHPWGQNSIIVRFPHKSKDDAPRVIVSAHADSTNMWPFLPAPGADDDGSGSTSVLEAFRALVHGNFTPAAPVEFHWYSAEEGGLLGSQAVAKAYEDDGVKVKAMLQMDMTAWVKRGTEKDEHIGLVHDFVSSELTKFVWETAETYLDIGVRETKCGYACSDHASFTKAGYPSAFAIESEFDLTNHNIHSTSDTIDHPEFSFSHMKEFSKLAIAFAYELSA